MIYFIQWQGVCFQEIMVHNLCLDQAPIDLTNVAIKVYDTDGNKRLTWKEVGNCENEFCDLLVLSVECTTKRISFLQHVKNLNGKLRIDEVFEYKEKLMEDEENPDLPLSK